MCVYHHGFKEARYSALSLIVFTGGAYVPTVNIDQLDCVLCVINTRIREYTHRVIPEYREYTLEGMGPNVDSAP